MVTDGGKIILCSHLGKPKGEPKLGIISGTCSSQDYQNCLDRKLNLLRDAVVGPNAKAAVEAMKDGRSSSSENTRYRAEETKNGEEFSKELASLCDVFVNDAFGTAHQSTLL